MLAIPRNAESKLFRMPVGSWYRQFLLIIGNAEQIKAVSLKHENAKMKLYLKSTSWCKLMASSLFQIDLKLK